LIDFATIDEPKIDAFIAFFTENPYLDNFDTQCRDKQITALTGIFSKETDCDLLFVNLLSRQKLVQKMIEKTYIPGKNSSFTINDLTNYIENNNCKLNVNSQNTLQQQSPINDEVVKTVDSIFTELYSIDSVIKTLDDVSKNQSPEHTTEIQQIRDLLNNTNNTNSTNSTIQKYNDEMKKMLKIYFGVSQSTPTKCQQVHTIFNLVRLLIPILNINTTETVKKEFFVKQIIDKITETIDLFIESNQGQPNASAYNPSGPQYNNPTVTSNNYKQVNPADNQGPMFGGKLKIKSILCIVLAVSVIIAAVAITAATLGAGSPSIAVAAKASFALLGFAGLVTASAVIGVRNIEKNNRVEIPPPENEIPPVENVIPPPDNEIIPINSTIKINAAYIKQSTFNLLPEIIRNQITNCLYARTSDLTTQKKCIYYDENRTTSEIKNIMFNNIKNNQQTQQPNQQHNPEYDANKAKELFKFGVNDNKCLYDFIIQADPETKKREANLYKIVKINNLDKLIPPVDDIQGINSIHTYIILTKDNFDKGVASKYIWHLKYPSNNWPSPNAIVSTV
jgi:hypothetical protein